MIVETAIPQIFAWFYVYVLTAYLPSLPILRHECVVSNSLDRTGERLIVRDIVRGEIGKFSAGSHFFIHSQV